jgi:hypothetical protein
MLPPTSSSEEGASEASDGESDAESLGSNSEEGSSESDPAAFFDLLRGGMVGRAGARAGAEAGRRWGEEQGGGGERLRLWAPRGRGAGG